MRTVPLPLTDREDAAPCWHALSADATLQRLGTSLEGLDDREAAARLSISGPNRLPAARPRSALVRFLMQFQNLLIYVLLAAAAVTGLLGHVVDMAVIVGVVILNAVFGFVQEGRAEKALDAIRGMIAPRASVIRNGRRMTVDAEALVAGDVVLLEAGDRVAADLRLLRSRNLRIDEAILTGESFAVEKGVSPIRPDAALGDRSPMAFTGTLVVAGNGRGVVVATGVTSELGRISAMLRSVEAQTTPLVRQMNQFARQLTLVVLGLSAAIFAFAVLVRAYPAAEAFMTVVGVAVAAIPEGLPAVMTIALAIGVSRMAARSAIVRRLPAVETLGSVSVICSDKTGTLTRNEMTVRSVVTAAAVYEVTGVGYAPRGEFLCGGRPFEVSEDGALAALVRAALLCNDATLKPAASGWIVDGDPMEGALVSLAIKAGHDEQLLRKQMPRLDEIPFDARHRLMASLHHGHDGDGAVAYVKGAPERILELCSGQFGADGRAPLDRPRWLAEIERIGAHGQRVLAIGMKEMPAGTTALSFEDIETDLVLLGLVGLIDPPREEAVEAIRECREAGIRVKMITGDHAATASAIAGQLGLLDHHRVMTGEDVDAMDDAELRKRVADTAVFARTSPEHKLRIVEALQADGAIVAMTGDGVNDAPALKRADVGVAMGNKGSEAAKEAAEMVLADDNFASIVAAIREGRTVHDNLKKVIGWTLPTNGGESLAVIAALLFGMTLPVTPVQILWINMVTAVALGLTLAFEPTEPQAMRRPPRAPDEPLLSGFLVWRVVLVSLLFVAGAFGMFFWALGRGLGVEEARTIVVNTIVVMEIFYLFSVRYLYMTSMTWTGILGTPAVLIGVGATAAAQLAFTYAPVMQSLFQTRAVSMSEGAAIMAVGVGLLAVLELEKLVRRAVVASRGAGARATPRPKE